MLKLEQLSTISRSALRTLPSGPWIVEYAFGAEWSRLSLTTLIRILLDDPPDLRGIVIDKLKEKAWMSHTPSTTLTVGLPLLLATIHYHLDRDAHLSSYRRARFRLRHTRSEDVIPEEFVTQECMCPRAGCQACPRPEPSQDTATPDYLSDS